MPRDDLHTGLDTDAPTDWFRRVIIVIVVVVWTIGAIAQVLGGSYVQPWWVHVIALLTISFALTGRFVSSRMLSHLGGGKGDE